MKEGNNKRFRKFGYSFTEYKHVFPNKKGNKHKKHQRYYTKAARNIERKETNKIINEALLTEQA